MVVNDSEGGNCSNGESGGIHSNMEHSGSHSKGGSHGSTMCNGNTNKPENSSCEISNHENERTRSENEERIQILEVCNHDNRKKSVPRKFSSFGGAVRRKMSIVPDDATPVQWKMILLIFISLVRGDKIKQRWNKLRVERLYIWHASISTFDLVQVYILLNFISYA